MLDMGFIRDIRKILALLPPRRQNLLFSATFSDEIRRLSDGILANPAQVQVTPRNQAAELVSQLVHPVDRERKRELLSHLVRSGRIDQALVFTRTKHGANRLADQLERDGIAATAIHGNKSQPQRVRALADFKAGRATILVATDIAARGLDIDSLPHVVNYEMPMVAEDYIHRIGRTGRAGAEGVAVSLICVDEGKLLWAVESLLRKKIPSEVVEGFEPDRSIRPEPILLRSAGGGRPSQPARQGGFARPGHARPSQPARAGQPGRSSQPGRSGQPLRPGQSIGGFAPARRPDDRPHRSASARPVGRPASERPDFRGAPARPDQRPAAPRSGHAPAQVHDRALGPGPRQAHDPRQAPGFAGQRVPRPASAMPGERFARPAGRRPDDRGG